MNLSQDDAYDFIDAAPPSLLHSTAGAMTTGNIMQSLTAVTERLMPVTKTSRSVPPGKGSARDWHMVAYPKTHPDAVLASPYQMRTCDLESTAASGLHNVGGMVCWRTREEGPTQSMNECTAIGGAGPSE